MKDKFNFFIFQFSFYNEAKRQKGFTLLEVMIAFAILSLSLIALISLRNSSMRAIDYSDKVTTATLLAKAKIEDMPRPISTGASEGDFDEDGFKGYKWKRAVSATSISFLKELSVTVSWDEERGSVRLVVYE